MSMEKKAKFLGRSFYDEKTMTWSFEDGSGVVPEEMRQDVLCAMENRNIFGHNGLNVLLVIWVWKDRLKRSFK